MAAHQLERYPVHEQQQFTAILASSDVTPRWRSEASFGLDAVADCSARTPQMIVVRESFLKGRHAMRC